MKSTRKFIRSFIQDCQCNRNSQYAAIIKRDYPILYQLILDEYPTLHPSQSLYNFVNDITTAPVCVECTNSVKFINYSKGYHQFCGQKCKNSSNTVKEKRKQTNIEKYGTSSVLTSTHGKEKTRKTIQKKYGVDHYSKTPEFTKKFKATMQDRYQCDYAMQSEELRERYSDSLESNHGVRHPSQSPEIYQNRNRAMKEKYGFEHAMQSEQLKERHHQTLQYNYGVDVPLQSEEIHNRFKQTMTERYGKEFTAQVNWLFSQMRQTNLEKYGVEFPLQNETIKKQMRLKMEKQGKWIPLELISDANLYYKQVIKYTNKQPTHLLENFERRGLAGIDGAYHIDHKVSIKYGFENSILPYIIGSIHNLEMLPWKDNIYKSSDCSMEPDLLFEMFTLQCL
jgi:hypothetical protein